MYYPARFTLQPEGGYVVTFRDVPEAITQGETLGEANEMAEEVLLLAMDAYLTDYKRPFPEPSQLEEGEEWVAVPPAIFGKALVFRELWEQRISQVELARRMNIKPQQVTHLLSLSKNTKVETLAEALRAMNRHLHMSVTA